MSSETIMQIASQLQAEGKTPSVALVKSRLSEPKPIPEIISGLQRWRNQQAGTAPSHEASVEPTPTAPEMPAELAYWLTPMQQEIQQLKREVAQLRQALVQQLRETQGR
ncbi:MAG: DNA-binding protein [Aeromonadaceae bacterium]